MSNTGYRGNPWLRRFEDFDSFHLSADLVICG